jgi:AraC family transcriptional regulator of arabinose operon
MAVTDYQIFLDDVQYYGRRRSKETILPSKLIGVVDYTKNCGWHKCNDKYFIYREAQSADDYLLLLTVAGEGVAILDRTEYSLSPNTLMILPKAMRHEYSVPEGSTWEFYWIHLSGVNCESLLKHIIDEYGHCLEIDCADEIIDSIELLLNTPYRYYEYEFFAGKLISNMLFMLINSLNSSMEDVQKRRTVTVNVIEYIEKHYGESMKLSDISDGMYISTEHLIRVFREEMGMTPYQYLKQFRMRKAFMYLSDLDRTIGDIAASVGYQSLSSFIAQFKEFYGITPRKYRRFFVMKPPAQ